MPKKPVMPEVRSAAAVAAFFKFRADLVDEPTEKIENGAFGIAEARICFRNQDLMPEWVEYSIDVGLPISSKSVLRILDSIDQKALAALVRTMFICGDGDPRSFETCLRLELCRRVFEPAFRALVPRSYAKPSAFVSAQ